MRRLHHFLLTALVALAWAGSPAARAADEPVTDKVVELPPFLVEEVGKGPPWRYAELPGFEFLSRCNDTTTRNIAEAYYQLHQLLAVVLPEELQIQFTVPRAVILYDDELQPAASREVVAQMLRREEARTPQLDDPASLDHRRLRAPSRRVNFLPNLRLSDEDAITIFSLVRQDSLDTDTLFLTNDYVTFMLKNRVPALPAWFTTGFLALYRDMTFRGGEITLKPLQWMSDAETDAVKRDPKIACSPAPLREFFTGELLRRDLKPAPRDVPATPEPGTDAPNKGPTIEGMTLPRAALNWDQLTVPERAQLWTAEASLLFRWALDEKNLPRRTALWKFVERASTESMSEKLFQECFGLDYAAVQQQLASFLPTAVHRTDHFRLPPASKPPPLPLRDASSTEIARLKGDWERLEIPFVKQLFPEAAPKYLEQARRTLMRAYDRDDRDPRLLAVLGLCECDAGDDARAREFLESAARFGDLRPRACRELARLRLADALAHPAGPAGLLSTGQMAAVLTPLFAARKLSPPLPEVYELIAEAWSHSAFPASRPHLAVLDEGVALFPRRTELVYRTAALDVQRGFFPEAKLYIDLGLRIAPDDAGRQRFADLKTQLPSSLP